MAPTKSSQAQYHTCVWPKCHEPDVLCMAVSQQHLKAAIVKQCKQWLQQPWHALNFSTGGSPSSDPVPCAFSCPVHETWREASMNLNLEHISKFVSAHGLGAAGYAAYLHNVKIVSLTCHAPLIFHLRSFVVAPSHSAQNCKRDSERLPLCSACIDPKGCLFIIDACLLARPAIRRQCCCHNFLPA